MKIFNNESWSEKVNFVDENNVVVGYDMSQHCCENAGYYFTGDEPHEKQAVETRDDKDPPESELAPYRFDPEWFRELSMVYDGGACAFRLTAPNLPDKYLVLFNSHNGYYSHGFTMEVGGVQKREGRN